MENLTRNQLRTVKVNIDFEQKVDGFFHLWSQEPFNNEQGGYITETLGLVEFEDGSVKWFKPGQITFSDQPRSRVY